MNLTQLHDRLRAELLRRIQRGTLSVSLLSRQTGFGRSHVSNFLHARGQLSLEAMDRLLAAQHLAAEDLLPPVTPVRHILDTAEPTSIPLVSHMTALYEPVVRSSAVQMILHLPPGSLHGLRSKPVASRRSWERYVAIRVDQADASPMDPLLYANAIAVIDRHYNSLVAYRPARPNLYAVRNGAHLTLRYADYRAERLVLRPLNPASPVDLIEIRLSESPGEYIAGRVVLTMNEL